MNSEFKRKMVHISMAGFAVFIGRFEPWLIVTLCGAAFLFNLLVLPKISRRKLEREADLKRGYALGLLAYPAVLLFLSLVFWERQVILALAWGCMAFGDGMAGLIGAFLGGPRIPWNRSKGWFGFLAFILVGGPLTLGLLYLLPESSRLGVPLETWMLAVAVSICFAAWVETLAGTIDDNLAVPLSGAFCGWVVLSLEVLPVLPAAWAIGLLAVMALTAISVLSRKIDVFGGLIGGLSAWLIFLGGGWSGLGLLLSFFLLGSLASQWKFREKAALGLAQEGRGRRSVRHALANGGAAALCGLLAFLFPQQGDLYRVMLAASLAAATADTLSSELGIIYGRRFVQIIGAGPGNRGDDGVISLEGSLFGVGGALLIGLLFALGNLGSQGALVGSAMVVAGAGVFGNLVDSLLGGSLQRRGLMDNDTVNFANTLCAALFAMALYLLL